MLEIRDLSKRYRSARNSIVAVDRACLQLNRGDLAVITGPSGSGKTTLLSLVGGITRPDEGSIAYNGNDLLAMSDRESSGFRAETVGFMFQFHSLLPTLTALENVLVPSFFAPSGGKSLRSAAEGLLTRAGLADRFAAFPYELSSGQQRRVAVARALLNDPKILLCDEPTGDLDQETEQVIVGMILDAKSRGAIVLLVTHNRALLAHADRALTMRDGRLA
jgi:putative ABC transport system ATP-binding protein